MKAGENRSLLLLVLLAFFAGGVLGWACREWCIPSDQWQNLDNGAMARRLVEELGLDREQRRNLSTVIKVTERNIDLIRRKPDNLKPEARRKIAETRERLDYIIQNAILTPSQHGRYMSMIQDRSGNE